MNSKAYTILMALMLASVGLKYQGSETNPFQQSNPTILLFLIAILCHAVASTAEMSLPTTVFIFHMSGIVGCETLLWILVAEFWWWYIINVLLLLVASFCFNYKDVSELIRGTRHMPNLEVQEAQA